MSGLHQITLWESFHNPATGDAGGLDWKRVRVVHATGSSREDSGLAADLAADTPGASEAALKQIYRRHSGAVFGFVACCTGNHLVAYNVVEEVFLYLWRQPQSFDPTVGSLRSHLVKDGYRRLQARGRLEQPEQNDGDQSKSDEAHNGPSFERLPTRAQEAGWQALHRDERVAIGLARFGEMTTLEVAEFLGVDQDIADSLLTRGLRRFAGAAGLTRSRG